MKRKIVFLCLIVMMIGLLSGCGGNSAKTATVAPASTDAVSATPNVPEKSPQADIMEDAVLGAKLSYFDAKFGAGSKKDDELTYSYMDGKIRVTPNQDYAYNIYNPYVDRGETPSPEDALAFIKQFLPKDAVEVKDEEDAATKIQTYTYTSEALKVETGLAGQFKIDIYKDPDDATKVRQAQISMDITANL